MKLIVPSLLCLFAIAAGCESSSNPSGGGLCSNTCQFAGDGECDDGDPGSETSFCDRGTDCLDCGPRGASGSGSIGTDAGEVDDCPCDMTFAECDQGCGCDPICDLPPRGAACVCDVEYCAGGGVCQPSDACVDNICRKRCLPRNDSEDCPEGTFCIDRGILRSFCN